MRFWLSLWIVTFIMVRRAFQSRRNGIQNPLLLLSSIGSDARQAKPALEAKGFECHWAADKTFSGSEGRHDFLYRDLEKMIGVLVSRRWQLPLIHKDFAVSDTKFGISLTGL